ncbi:MAG: hypothetical protein AAB676_09525 [Verrucomicrobiota bacterium]
MNPKTGIGHKELKETQRGMTALPEAESNGNEFSLSLPEPLFLWSLCSFVAQSLGCRFEVLFDKGAYATLRLI